MTDANEKKIKDMLGTDTASQEVAEKAVAEAKKDLDEEMRLRKIKLIKIGSALAFVTIAMVIMTLGWFTMNKDNSASGMGASVKAMSFKLKSKGSIPMSGAYSAVPEYKDGIADNNNEYYYTGTNNDDVKWRMELTSAEQLEPGASGALTFWVVPDKPNTSLDMKFSMTMRGFTYQNSTWTESTNSTALGYLDTHILFFKERYPETVDGKTVYSYSGLIDPDFTELALTEDDEVNIYWVWPNTFKQMMYVDGSTELGTSKGIAHDSDTLDEIKLYVSDNKTRMFPSGTADLNANVANCCGTTATAEAKTASITVLDGAYNAADTVIGSAFQGALTELKAEALSEHEIP